jgi:uncharacterized membrane protein YciS (DUF1049 family)
MTTVWMSVGAALALVAVMIATGASARSWVWLRRRLNPSEAGYGTLEWVLLALGMVVAAALAVGVYHSVVSTDVNQLQSNSSGISSGASTTPTT